MGNCEVVINRSHEVNDEALFHSDTFLGEEFDDEMCHWKYVKRVKKPNGKYRYYYDREQVKEDLGVNAKEEYESAKYHEKYTHEAKKFWEDSLTSRVKEYTSNGKITRGEAAALKLASENYEYQKVKIAEAKARVSEAAVKYGKTPLGKLEKAKNKGKNFIKKLFKIK